MHVGGRTRQSHRRDQRPVVAGAGVAVGRAERPQLCAVGGDQ